MLEHAAKVLGWYVCDHCLGRHFSKLLSGYTNAERGRALRTSVALSIDGGSKFEGNVNNFVGFKFRENQDFEKLPKKAGTCEVCNGLFQGGIEKLAARVSKQLGKVDFNNFLVGTQLSEDLLQREEKLWEKVGIDYTEPIRSEINREVGKQVEKLTGKRANLLKPDIAVLLDMKTQKVKLTVNPLFILGYYQKLKRGFPQSKWGTPRKYATSVEEEIGRPLLKLTKGKDTKFHGAGREDIDARNLAWRAFVIEVNRPTKRAIDLRKLEKLTAKGHKVRISKLKISDMATVRAIKEAAPDKTYRALVKLGKPVRQADLKKLKKLVGSIHQRTPVRVAHRRAELLRKREVKSLRWKRLGAKKLELIVKGTAGLYIKELVSSDEGRTKPSVAEILGVPAKVTELDVIDIGKIKL